MKYRFVTFSLTDGVWGVRKQECENYQDRRQMVVPRMWNMILLTSAKNPRTQLGDSFLKEKKRKKTSRTSGSTSLSCEENRRDIFPSLLWQPWACTAFELPKGLSLGVNHTPVTTGTPNYEVQSPQSFTDGGASQFSWAIKERPIWHK